MSSGADLFARTRTLAPVPNRKPRARRLGAHSWHQAVAVVGAIAGHWPVDVAAGQADGQWLRAVALAGGGRPAGQTPKASLPAFLSSYQPLQNTLPPAGWPPPASPRRYLKQNAAAKTGATRKPPPPTRLPRPADLPATSWQRGVLLPRRQRARWARQVVPAKHRHKPPGRGRPVRLSAKAQPTASLPAAEFARQPASPAQKKYPAGDQTGTQSTGRAASTASGSAVSGPASELICPQPAGSQQTSPSRGKKNKSAHAENCAAASPAQKPAREKSAHHWRDGVFGCHFAARLLAEGVVCGCWTPSRSPSRSCLGWAIRGDVRERAAVDAAVAGVDAVVRGDGTAAGVQTGYFDNWDRGDKTVLAAAQAAGVERVVNFFDGSTASRITPLVETDQLAGVGAYGTAKVQAESVVDPRRAWCQRAKRFIGTGRPGVFRFCSTGRPRLPDPVIGSGTNRYQLLAAGRLVAAWLV